MWAKNFLYSRSRRSPILRTQASLLTFAERFFSHSVYPLSNARALALFAHFSLYFARFIASCTYHALRRGPMTARFLLHYGCTMNSSISHAAAQERKHIASYERQQDIETYLRQRCFDGTPEFWSRRAQAVLIVIASQCEEWFFLKEKESTLS